MEQEQTPKDEGFKAGGSMPCQPEGEKVIPTPADSVAETEPAEDTGAGNPVGGDDVDPDPGETPIDDLTSNDGTGDQAESEAKELDEDRAKAEGDEDQARNEEATGEAETEGGERNE